MARNKSVAVVGAIVGLALYVGIALKAALLYGAYGGLLLATGIFGSPLPNSILARGLVGFGSILGMFATAAVFAVSGAGTATVIAQLVDKVRKAAAGPAHEAADAGGNHR